MFVCVGFGPKAARSLAHCLVTLILLPCIYHPSVNILIVYKIFYTYEGFSTPLPFKSNVVASISNNRST